MRWPVGSMMAACLASGCAGDPDDGDGERPADTDAVVDTDPDDTPPAGPPGGNILLIVLDDVGIDKIGAYGYHPTPAHTPTIDALAAQGVLFEQAYALAACSSTRAALLTGRHARRTGMGDVADYFITDYSLPHEEVLIPEMLRESELAYTSVASGKWHLAVDSAPEPFRDPLDQGFARYAGTVENLPLRIDLSEPEGTYYLWDRNEEGSVAPVEGYATTVQVDDAVERILAVPEPWFGYVALNAAHGPLLLPPPDDLYTVELPAESTQGDIVAAILEAADTEIARLLASIPPDVLARTTVMVLGDNGTADIAILPPWDPQRSKNTLYEGGVRVPLIVAGPLVTQPGTRSPSMVHVVDVLPTLAEIAGVDATALVGSDGAPILLDGSSFLSLVRDPAGAPIRDRVYTEKLAPNGPPPYTKQDVRMLRDANHKLIVNLRTDTVEFFALTAGVVDEGPNLLASDVPLSAVDLEAFERLDAELRTIAAEDAYEGPI
ncbi:MAG: sulfatase-like hydrolase/transferase [Deltaproteobacteria bacterium]|nr:sulfatase-like hydrolase/transferase [Deltaproteobacteria bacterium]